MVNELKYDYIKWSEFDNIVNRFVDLTPEKKYDAIISIAKGGLIPGVTLAHRLGINDFNIIRIQRNHSNEPYSKKINPIFEDFDYEKLKGKKLLIVDDIAGTGRTLIELIKKLEEHGITDYAVFVVVKFDGDYSPDKNLKIDFFGKICNNWVIFPWERQFKMTNHLIKDPERIFSKKKRAFNKIKLYFVTSNKYKIAIFNKVMQPAFIVNSFQPKEEIIELNSRSVKDVVQQKLNDAYKQFPDLDGFLFVTDVGLYIDQLNGLPGALIKRLTKSLFNGNFKKWCDYLDETKSRTAYVQMIIAARNPKGKSILVDHRVKGFIPLKPLPGNHGFDWDEIFVPNPDLVQKEFKNKSFAQIPEDVKFNLLIIPAINDFKKQLGVITNEQQML